MKVVETVVVERQVAGETVKVVETVVVERPVTRVEKVVETVIVERQVAGETVKVVETVVVEKPVTRVEQVVQTVVVTTEKVVEKMAPGEFYGEVVANNTDTPAGEILQPGTFALPDALLRLHRAADEGKSLTPT